MILKQYIVFISSLKSVVVAIGNTFDDSFWSIFWSIFGVFFVVFSGSILSIF